jgi:hypothetical protein
VNIDEKLLYNIGNGSEWHMLAIAAGIALFAALLFSRSVVLRKAIGYLLLASLFLYILNPSIITQYVFHNAKEEFINSGLNLFVMYINFIAAIYFAAGIIRGSSKFSVACFIFTPACIYQAVNMGMIIYDFGVKDIWLNYLSMVAYCFFIAFLFALNIYSWFKFFKHRQKIDFRTGIELVFIFLIAFPTVLFSRTDLVFSIYGMVDFYGNHGFNPIALFQGAYWYCLLYYVVYTVLFLLYYYKVCKDKRGFVYKVLLAVLVTAYVRRATIFYQYNFGLSVLLDSPCAFYPAAYLLFLKFKKETFAYYLGVFIIWVSLVYVFMLVELTGSNLFTYLRMDSFLFHLYITPVALTVFSFSKVNKYKYVLYTVLFEAVAQIIMGGLGNLIGFIDFKYGIDLNVAKFNGFLYNSVFFDFLTPLLKTGAYEQQGLAFYPLNYVLVPLFILAAASLWYLSIQGIRKLKNKKRLSL